jgi:hypothetical protein
MRNLKSFILGGALFLLSGAVMATGNLKVHIASACSDLTLVQISNVTESRYEIELKNEKGDIIFYKMTNEPSVTYAKQYDFSMLDNGIYNLTVNVDNEKMENSLKINQGHVDVIGQRKEVYPFFTVKENHLELSWLNFELENPKVLLYDNNTLLFEKELDPEFSVNYALDFSNLERGNYYAVLQSDTSHFEYRITKK